MENKKIDMKWCSGYCRQYWPEECAHILRIADDAVAQRFLFDLPWDMEQTVKAVTFEGKIDWRHMPEGDPEFIYQFNRHRYWICMGQAYALTGDGKYARCFVNQLYSWLEDNPINQETKNTTWRTIEAGIRGENWVKAMEYFEDCPVVTRAVRERFLEGLRVHGEYLMDCRVPFSDKSNWGVLESHGLFAIGAYLMKCRGNASGEDVAGAAAHDTAAHDTAATDAAAGLARRGEAYVAEAVLRLVRELDIQIMDDGVQWEQSPMYHNEVLRCLLEVLRVTGQQGISLPRSLPEKARAMALADLAWMKPDRTQPLNGDSDRTDLRDVFTPAAWILKDNRLRYAGYDRLDFESVWDLGADAALEYESMRSETPECLFHALEQSGNWCLRSGWDRNADYLHFKCGSLGGGHGHFDKLHVDLSIAGEDVLIDSGRYTYVDGSLRRQLKSSCAHNVPVVDWQEYTQCTGSWDVKGRTAPAGQDWSQKGPYTFLQGTHLGYLPAGVLVNRRIISIGTRIHMIADEFYGTGTHVLSQVFHLNPAGSVEMREDVFLYHGIRAEAAFYRVAPWSGGGGGKMELEETPVSFHYNQLEYAPCVSLWRESALPCSMLTVAAGYETGSGNPYTVSRVSVTSPVTGRCLKDEEAEAVRIQDGKHSWLVVLNHLETGADGEYIGAEGRYGLGRVMVCDEADREGRMTVLQW